MNAIADEPTGATLDAEDRAVYEFATKVARDASSVEQATSIALRAVGLSDDEVADVVFAVAARAFFTTVLDGLGARLDDEIASTFTSEVLAVAHRRTTAGAIALTGAEFTSARIDDVPNYDTIVVGGGMAGVSIGYELAADRTVALLDMEATLAYHTTGRSAAMFLESYGGPPPSAR